MHFFWIFQRGWAATTGPMSRSVIDRPANNGCRLRSQTLAVGRQRRAPPAQALPAAPIRIFSPVPFRELCQLSTPVHHLSAAFLICSHHVASMSKPRAKGLAAQRSGEAARWSAEEGTGRWQVNSAAVSRERERWTEKAVCARFSGTHSVASCALLGSSLAGDARVIGPFSSGKAASQPLIISDTLMRLLTTEDLWRPFCCDAWKNVATRFVLVASGR